MSMLLSGMFFFTHTPSFTFLVGSEAGFTLQTDVYYAISHEYHDSFTQKQILSTTGSGSNGYTRKVHMVAKAFFTSKFRGDVKSYANKCSINSRNTISTERLLSKLQHQASLV